MPSETWNKRTTDRLNIDVLSWLRCGHKLVIADIDGNVMRGTFITPE